MDKQDVFLERLKFKQLNQTIVPIKMIEEQPPPRHIYVSQARKKGSSRIKENIDSNTGEAELCTTCDTTQ